MPELPEVEAVVRKLRREAVGAVITGAHVFRARATHPQSPELLEGTAGRTIHSVERHGKNIVVRLDSGIAVRVHLRMTGNFYVIPDARMHPATTRAMLTLQDGRAVVLDDPRLLGSIHLHTDAELLIKLQDIGMDPMSRSFTAKAFCAAAKECRRPVKLFLMEQWPISGLGNIYAAESLFHARIHPARPVYKLRATKLAELHRAIRQVLRKALPAAIRSYTRPGVHDGMDYYVYSREGEPCRVCGRSIQRIEQGGRSTYFCPGCQRI